MRTGLDSRLHGNDEFQDYGVVGDDEFQDCGVVGNDGFQDYGIVGNDGSGISLRPPRACKRQVHQKYRLKVQTASVSGNQRAGGWASARHFHQSNISTVFIESIESVPFDNPALRN
ncbi:hypothetical protein [Neisseria polysaccharea]|uniref:hypothetical protein n=1 Tax=Neisseria polysaccharea TaxID=489 RepID=UPI0027DF90C1|nr:hypothetical protein [Neisseria polysaccharea]